MKYRYWLFFVLMICAIVIFAQKSEKNNKKVKDGGLKAYKTGELLYEDSFDKSLDNWVLEYPDSPDSKVGIVEGKLVVDVDGGTTVWLNKKLEGNILIKYKRRVVMEGGKNDRLSDLNQFWMATDPRNENLFTRSGIFKEYDSLSLYYFGFGGNTNSTTRFRKYTGDGNRVLIYDFNDKKHLLKPNKVYTIVITVFEGVTKVFIDGKEIISYLDEDPLKEGYFGFRTTESRQEMDDLEIYRLVAK